jgi:subtilisin family serine protease
MKWIGTLIVLLGLLASSAGVFAKEAPARINPRTYLVLFQSQNAIPGNAEELVAQAGGTLKRSFPQLGVVVAVSEDTQFSARLSRAPEVLSVAPDPMIKWIPDLRISVHQEILSPAEPQAHDPTQAIFFPLQWNMRAIDADDAWAAGYQGDPAVTVAILDTGVDPTHIDLAGKVDPGRSASFVEDLPEQPECSDPSLIDALFPGQPPWIDLHAHGTHVAGIVAAQGIGVSGVAPHVSLMAVKVANVCGSGLISWIIAGIVYAADNGADVINMSLGFLFPRSCRFEEIERRELRNECAAVLAALNRATTYASRQGTLVIAAAGNDALDLDQAKDLIFLPAEGATVLAVSATGPVDAIGIEPDTPASYTNYGQSLVDVAAPGGDHRRFPEGDWDLDMVLSTCSRFSLLFPICQTGFFYVFADGTSMAAPHAAGVAALADSLFNGGLNAAQLGSIVESAADDLGKPGHDEFYGHGRVNAYNAVTR